MSDAENKVNSVWERVIVCDGSYRHYKKGTVLLNWANHCFYEFDSWSAALAFTEQRLREIAEVEEEITLLERWRTISGATKRILAREQAHLAELKRGMKAEATQ